MRKELGREPARVPGPEIGSLPEATSEVTYTSQPRQARQSSELLSGLNLAI